MSVIDIDKKVQQLSTEPSDINEHFPILLEYGRQCDHITEMGVRWIVSTWVFLAARPSKLVSYDILHPKQWNSEASLDDVFDTANSLSTDYEFIQANVLDVEIEPTDLLFIDTWHAYRQMKAELAAHSDMVKQFIILHDTTTFGDEDERSYEAWGPEWQGTGKGVWPAIAEFLQENHNWILERRYVNNNGLTVLRKA